MNQSELVSKIIAYENGEMSDRDYIEFFAYLIKSGICWQLQSMFYGNPARDLIAEGIISASGDILVDLCAY